jgi:pilus assembly protein CpaE
MSAPAPISIQAAPQLLADTPPPVAVVDIAESEHPAADIRAVVAATGGRTRIIAIGTVNDIALYRSLREAGAADYLVKPYAADQLTAAIARSNVTHALPPQPAAKRPRTLFVTGARGGAGATTLAVDAAWHLSQRPQHRVALIDLDLSYGSVALALDLEPSHGLHDILENPDRVDGLLISSAIARISDTFSVLATEETRDRDKAAAPMTGEACAKLFETIAENADCIIADAPRSVLAGRPSLLEHADALIIVSELNLVSARDVVRLTDLVRDVAPGCTVSLIANKIAKGRTEIADAAFTRAAKLDFASVLPWDLAGAKAAANAGQPLGQAAPNSVLHRSIAAAVDALVPMESAATSKPFWRRLVNVRSSG